MRSLQRNDVELRYDLIGNGPPVLCIQGVGVSGNGWQPQVQELKQHFQLLTFDNRGVGQSIPCRGPVTIASMAEDACALMNAVGWDSAHVVGHSMGGVIAQQLALDHPKRIRSLSLLCTFARGKDAARLTPWVLWMTLRTRIGTRRMRRRAFLEMIWSDDRISNSRRDELAEQLASIFGRDLADSPPVILKQIRALAQHDASNRLHELSHIPSLVLSAERDPIAPPCYGKSIVTHLPKAQFAILEGVSHAAPIQQAAEVNYRLRAFIDSAERADDRSQEPPPSA